jgi:subtilisin family serine protease
MGYSYQSGFGFVNAAAAVAAAIGQAPFPNVEDETYPDGTEYDWDWGINMVNAPEAWLKGYQGQGITVAVLDTGVDLDHPDLADNIWVNPGEIPENNFDDDGNGFIDDVNGWNFYYDSNNTWDANGHGTHVAGTIAAVDDNSGTTGVAPSAKIMPIQVLDDLEGRSALDPNTVAQGIYYAVNNGARVLNLSLGGTSLDAEQQAAIEYAAQKGCIVVMAAGNDGGGSPNYPAVHAESWGLAVGAIDSQGYMADFSNRAGDNLSAYITAPGVDIGSTAPDEDYYSGEQDYRILNGTSMATPHVAGIVALMLSANPNLTDAYVRNILASTSSNASLSSSSSLDAAIYRFQNTEQPGTYLYVGEEERQNILASNPNFSEEGFAFNVGVAPEDDLLPLYRFQNIEQPGTYLYVGEEERQSILDNNPDFTEEGLAFYVHGAGSGLGAPLYRFQNTEVPGTYLYAGASERDGILADYPNFVDEGMAFEIGA